MTTGNMQYGTNNNSGSDPTTLTSAAAPNAFAVENSAPGGPAIVGIGTGEGHGVAGYSNGCKVPENCYAGAGVYGENTAGGYGIVGESAGIGVGGYSSTGSGVDGQSYSGGDGVTGHSTQRNGVQGVSDSQQASGVYGENMSGGGFGIAGRSNVPLSSNILLGAGVFGDNIAGGYAGVFNGAVYVNGQIHKSGGGFRIDHPADPANSYLHHSFVESPDMMNVYNGNVTTDDDGNASVPLPVYFGALNRDFCYQLTVVGQFAQAIIAEEINNNRFSIRTDKPNVRVSWQVTGIRQDAWANAHRTEAEAEKPDGERGRYLAPEEHGQPVTAGLFYMELPAPQERRVQYGARPRS